MEPQSGGGSDFFGNKRKLILACSLCRSVLVIFTVINQDNPTFLGSHDLNPLPLLPGDELQEKSSDWPGWSSILCLSGHVRWALECSTSPGKHVASSSV